MIDMTWQTEGVKDYGKVQSWGLQAPTLPCIRHCCYLLSPANPKISLVATVLPANRNNHISRLFLCRFPTVTFSNCPGVSLRDGHPMLQVHDLDSYVTPGPGTYNAHTTSFVYWATAQPCLAHHLHVFFDGGVRTLGGWLFWWRSWLFTDSQIHSCFKEIVFFIEGRSKLQDIHTTAG